VLTPSINSASPAKDSARLILVKAEKPVYPIEAVKQEIQGEVVVHLLISETGDVEKADAISGDPMLVRSATDAMKKWKFKPYLKDGHPVKVSTRMTYDFAFKDRVKDVSPDTTPTEPKPLSGAPSPTPSIVSSASPSLDSRSLQPVRVASAISQGMLIHRVTPIYPASARINHVQGTVLLQAVIGKDGHLKSLTVISGPEELRSAAIGAVQQWRYRPYMKEGEPVDVSTTITVNFTLHGF
jgi:TonB family protein